MEDGDKSLIPLSSSETSTIIDVFLKSLNPSQAGILSLILVRFDLKFRMEKKEEGMISWTLE